MGSRVSCDVHELRNISEEAASKWIFNPVDTFAMTICLPIVLGLGLLTNLSLLFIFLRVPRLRSETDVYLANLALSDVLFLILWSAYDIRKYAFSPVSKSMPFRTTVECTLFYFATTTAFGASTGLVTMVTFERCLALCHPIQHLKMRSQRRTYKMVAICWGIGVGLSALITPSFSQHVVICLRWPDNDMYTGYPLKISSCTSIFQWMQYISEPLVNIPWCSAMIGNIYMYVRIVLALNKRKRVNAERKSAKDISKALQTRNQVAKMLVISGVVSFLCQAPFALLNLTSWICLFIGDVDNSIGAVFGEHAHWIVQSPLLINTVVNPLIYCAFNAQYRAAFTEAFGCNRRPGRQSANHPVHAVCPPRSNNHATAQGVNPIDTSKTRL